MPPRRVPVFAHSVGPTDTELRTETRATPDPVQRSVQKLGVAVLLAAASDATNRQLPEARRASAHAFLREPSVLRDFWCRCAGVAVDRAPRRLETSTVMRALRGRRGAVRRLDRRAAQLRGSR
jgi:hypothetical protein